MRLLQSAFSIEGAFFVNGLGEKEKIVYYILNIHAL